jgi:dephospho-CoA kinase
VTLVGLTGGIATGKSTVAGILRSMGVPVIDADQVAREVVEPGEPALDRIAAAFGRDMLSPDGTLDRARLRKRIVRDPEARRTLESITHPPIRARIAARALELADAGHEHVVVEAALLVETGSYREYPILLVVSATPEIQIARLVSRDGITEEEARATLQAQLPLAEKEAVATHVIRNDGDRAALEARVSEVWSKVTAPISRR